LERKLFHAVGITAFLFLIFVTTFGKASQVEVVQVDPLTQKMLTFNLNDGQKFTGSLAVSGGSGNDIDFWVTDPQGTTILNLGRVSQGKTFEFTAQVSGAYTFHFSNTFSLLSSKTVSLSYDISNPIFGGIDFNLLLITIAAIILAIALVILAIVLSHRKSTSKTNQPPPQKE
jgi:hypothetical protein